MKRIFDLSIVLLLTPLWVPSLAVAYLFVIWVMGKPGLFRQERGGENQKIFKIVKLQTMTDAKDEGGNLLSDELRLTKVGKFLRKTSLDELPSLWNVVLGEMSLVGPRPFMAEYLPLYSPKQVRRHEVRPGITGWAQVNGRNAISWEEKFELDVWYVDNWSFWLDLKILFLTVKKVFVREGITAESDATMPKFKGSASV